MTLVLLQHGDWTAWHRFGAELATSPGVHRPSEFSALLATTLTDSTDRVIVDAGCGAGLIAISALLAGACHVIAQDVDPAALHDTAANVERLLGPEARSRLSLWQADFAHLGAVRADVIAVNPPQRPAALLSKPSAEDEDEHLHLGGGEDGLAALRLLLSHARCGEVRSTAASVLPIEAWRTESAERSWRAPERLAQADLPLREAWRPLVPELRTPVDVWRFLSR